jgi:predicted transcriptional regulator of viral defense system
MSTTIVKEQVLALAQEKRILRPRDLIEAGISRNCLQGLCNDGELVRTGRGVYALPPETWTEHHALAEVSVRIPNAVVCLLSALRFHGLTTQEPPSVWIALDQGKHQPRAVYPPIRVVRFSGKALSDGVESHSIEGVACRVFSPAKTVADCFKHRNKIGLDVALEALRETWRSKRVTMDELGVFAEVCRVSKVMRPYLESLL